MIYLFTFRNLKSQTKCKPSCSLDFLALPDVGDDGDLEALALQLGLAVDQGSDPDLSQAPRDQDATGGGNLGVVGGGLTRNRAGRVDRTL